MREGEQGMAVNEISMAMGWHISEKIFQFPLKLSKFMQLNNQIS